MLNTEWADEIDSQIAMQGVACITTGDGTVLVMTSETLEKWLHTSRGAGRIIVMVKRRPTA